MSDFDKIKQILREAYRDGEAKVRRDEGYFISRAMVIVDILERRNLVRLIGGNFHSPRQKGLSSEHDEPLR